MLGPVGFRYWQFLDGHCEIRIESKVVAEVDHSHEKENRSHQEIPFLLGIRDAFPKIVAVNDFWRDRRSTLSIAKIQFAKAHVSSRNSTHIQKTNSLDWKLKASSRFSDPYG